MTRKSASNCLSQNEGDGGPIFSRQILEKVLAIWTLGCAAIVAGGYALSSIHAFGSRPAWIGIWTVVIVSVGTLNLPRGIRAHDLKNAFKTASDEVRQSKMFVAIVVTAGVTIVSSAILGLSSAPSNWDSMTYHLTRVAYYAQFNSLDNYGANFWAQAAHGRVSSILLASVTVPFGMSDRLHALPQLSSLVVLILACAWIARWAGASRPAAIAGAAICGLCVNAIMQAATSQNDLIIAAFLAISVVGGLSFLGSGTKGNLVMAGLGIALAVGTKASALTAIPAVTVALIGGCFGDGGFSIQKARRLIALSAACSISFLIVAVPAGYHKNHVEYGNWLGPSQVQEEHMFKDVSMPQRFRLSILNAVRFGADAFTLDGIPESWGGEVGGTAKDRFGDLMALAGLDARNQTGVRGGSHFRFRNKRTADDNLSWFGIAGFGIFFPAVVLGAFGKNKKARSLALAAAAFAIIQCASGMYDPWRGRHFLYSLTFVAPLSSLLIAHCDRRYSLIAKAALAIAIFSALNATFMRQRYPFIPGKGSPAFWQLDRLSQMAIQHECYPALVNFEQIVESDAVVAVALPGDSYEYPLFGRGATRWLQPVGGRLPSDTWTGYANWLLYDSRLEVEYRTGDINLGYNWYLRPLHPVQPKSTTHSGAPDAANISLQGEYRTLD